MKKRTLGKNGLEVSAIGQAGKDRRKKEEVERLNRVKGSRLTRPGG